MCQVIWDNVVVSGDDPSFSYHVYSYVITQACPLGNMVQLTSGGDSGDDAGIP